MTPEGIEELRQHEGLRLEAYPDPASGGDPWTIGYGHTKGVKKGDTISRAQAEHFLLQDVAEAEDAIARLVKVPLSAGQTDALVSFVFNLGAGGLERSTLLERLNLGDYQGAAAQFDKWVYASGKVMHGLVARRAAERRRFLFDAPEQKTPAPVVDHSVRADPADIQAKIKESPVDPISALAVKSIIGMAADAIPGLIRMFGNKDNPVVERNAKAAQVILDTAKEVTGAINAQDAADKIQNDPEAAAKVRQAIMDNWFRINAEAEKSVAAAREFASNYRTEKTVRDGLTFIELLSLIFVTLSAVGGGYVLVADFPAELKGGVITLMLIGGWTGVKEFWLGSSRDSQRKTEMLTKQ